MDYNIFSALCAEKGTSPTALALKLGLSKGNTSSWKKGGNPSVEILIRLADELNCTADLLLGRANNTISNKLPIDEQELLDTYRHLSERDKGKVAERAQTLYEMNKETLSEHYQEQFAITQIPTISIHCSENRVSAGPGDDLNDYEQWDTVNVVDTKESRKADFMLIVDGDSMEPRFHDGDYVLVRQQPAVNIGEIGIFDVNGKGYIKKYNGNTLVSLNPAYDDIKLCDDNCRCFGLVLGVAELV